MISKRSTAVLGTALMLASVFAFQFQPVSAQSAVSSSAASASASQRKPSGIVPVKRARATVRVGRKSFAIGTLFGPPNPNPDIQHNDQFDAQINDGTARGWSWGRGLGNVDACGFIQLTALDKRNSSNHTPSCGRAPSGRAQYRAYLCRAFAEMTNTAETHGTSVRTRRATVLWGNFGAGGPVDKLFDIPATREVLWRWVTKRRHNNQRYVMVNFIVRQRDPHNVYPAGTSLWGYVKLADLNRLTNRRPC